jgi:uncharacterized protein YqgC (DUF456 family)
VDGFLPAGTQVWVPALIILVGTIGIVIPVLPGLFVTLLGTLLWAYETGGGTAWTIFGICVLWFVAGVAGQYLIPGRRLKAEGVSTLGLVFAAVCGIVGMFVIPVVGFFVGFVLGLFLLAYLPRRDRTLAWRRTKVALRAIATSIGIELVAAVLIALTWVVGVALTS